MKAIHLYVIITVVSLIFAITSCNSDKKGSTPGRHMGYAYIRGNTKTPIRTSDITIAGVLKASGYVTGMFGKWGLGNAGITGDPARKGFDEFTGYTDQMKTPFPGGGHHAAQAFPNAAYAAMVSKLDKNIVKFT